MVIQLVILGRTDRLTGTNLRVLTQLNESFLARMWCCTQQRISDHGNKSQIITTGIKAVVGLCQTLTNVFRCTLRAMGDGLSVLADIEVALPLPLPLTWTIDTINRQGQEDTHLSSSLLSLEFYKLRSIQNRNTNRRQQKKMKRDKWDYPDFLLKGNYLQPKPLISQVEFIWVY